MCDRKRSGTVWHRRFAAHVAAEIAEVRAALWRPLREARRGTVLLKGGHLPGGDSPDLPMTAEGAQRIECLPRLAKRARHRLPPVLSARDTALPRPAPPQAIPREKANVAAAIAQHDAPNVGSARGPVHPFHRFFWTPS